MRVPQRPIVDDPYDDKETTMSESVPNSALKIPSRKNEVSPEEWQARVELAAAYRLVAAFKWDDLVFTHISARVPGRHDQFLINPYGLMFEEITASSLIKVDAQGNKLDESEFPVNPAGFVIHSAIHAARHDAQCVLHVHTLNGIAVWITKPAGLTGNSDSSSLLPCASTLIRLDAVISSNVKPYGLIRN